MKTELNVGDSNASGVGSETVCETGTQTEWTGGWENIPFLGTTLRELFPFWSSGSPLLSFCVPPPPSSDRASPTSVIVNPLELSRTHPEATANGVNQFTGSNASLNGILHGDNRIHAHVGTTAVVDTDSEDEDECDAFEYEVCM